MQERANAKYEMVLLFEHIPHVLQSWLFENPDKIPAVLDDLRTAISFLREKQLIHFDAHYSSSISMRITATYSPTVKLPI
jgi:hypothetical protein